MSQTSTQVEVELLDLRIAPNALHSSDDGLTSEQQISTLSKTRSAAVIITVSCISFLNALGSGLLTVALPQIAKDLDLPQELLLWSVLCQNLCSDYKYAHV